MLKRISQHIVVIVFLILTLTALILTMTKLLVLPLSIVRWSYGMMAPYQGDTYFSADFVYEGRLPDGSWEVITIDPYMPYEFGETNVRKFLRIYQDRGTEGQRKKFTDFALILLERERARGTPYTAVRIWFEQWDRSSGGYEFLRTPLFTKRELVTIAQ